MRQYSTRIDGAELDIVLTGVPAAMLTNKCEPAESRQAKSSDWRSCFPIRNREDGFGDVDDGAPVDDGTALASQGIVFGFCL